MPIAQHLSTYWDWGMSKDEKKETEKILGIKHGPFASDDDHKQKNFLT